MKTYKKFLTNYRLADKYVYDVKKCA